MRGLLCSLLGRPEEADELVRAGVRSNVRSHVCWHVMGIVRRSENKNEEAVRCFKMALRLDPDNSMVSRDLALMQAQVRDLEGLVETRATALEKRSGQRSNWAALAAAHHLAGHRAVAAAVLEAYDATLDDAVAAAEPYERSEALLYRARIMEEDGQLEGALEALRNGLEKRTIRDAQGALRAQARLLVKLGRHAEATPLLWRALAGTPDDEDLHAHLAHASELYSLAEYVERAKNQGEDGDQAKTTQKTQGEGNAPGAPAGQASAEREKADTDLLAAPFAGASSGSAYAVSPAEAFSSWRDLPPQLRSRLAAKPLAAHAEGLLALYEEIERRFPRSNAPRRARLDLLSGEAAEREVERYVRRGVHRGVPSLAGDLAALLDRPETAVALLKAADKLVRELLEDAQEQSEGGEAPGGGATGADAKPVSGASELPPEIDALVQSLAAATISPAALPPVACAASLDDAPPLAWAVLLRAELARRLGEPAEALTRLAPALERFRSLPETHAQLSATLADLGDALGAFAAAEQARSLDLSDRFLNCRAVEAALRAGRPEAARQLACRFLREGDGGVGLVEMQASWYLLELADCWIRGDAADEEDGAEEKKEGGGGSKAARPPRDPAAATPLPHVKKALSRYLRILQHFEEFKSDEYDFHGYCARKQTLNSYVDMLALEDRLPRHPVAARAAAGAVDAYLRVADARDAKKREDERRRAEAAAKAAEAAKGEGADAPLSPEEAAKAAKAAEKAAAARLKREKKAAAKRAAAKEEAERAKQAAARAAAKARGEKAPSAAAEEARKKADPDVDGDAATADDVDVVAEALKVALKLADTPGAPPAASAPAARAAARAGKLLLAAKHALRAAEAAATTPDARRAVAEFVRAAIETLEKDEETKGEEKKVDADADAGSAALADPVRRTLKAALLAVADTPLADQGEGEAPLRAVLIPALRAWSQGELVGCRARSRAGALGGLRAYAAALETAAATGLLPAAEAADQLAGASLAQATHADAVYALEVLRHGLIADRAAAGKLVEAARARFPRSTRFGGDRRRKAEVALTPATARDVAKLNQTATA